MQHHFSWARCDAFQSEGTFYTWNTTERHLKTENKTWLHIDENVMINVPPMGKIIIEKVILRRREYIYKEIYREDLTKVFTGDNPFSIGNKDKLNLMSRSSLQHVMALTLSTVAIAKERVKTKLRETKRSVKMIHFLPHMHTCLYYRILLLDEVALLYIFTWIEKTGFKGQSK